MIPEYKLTLLPPIVLPYSNDQEVTKKYLGGRALTGEQYANFDIFMETNVEAKAVYDFWKDDCNYGTTPFLAPIPLFGQTYDKTLMTTLVQFIEDFSSEKIDVHWNQSVRVKVVGEVSYIQDDSLNYIVDDSGNYIVTDSISNSNKEITYGS